MTSQIYHLHAIFNLNHQASVPGQLDLSPVVQSLNQSVQVNVNNLDK